MGTYLGIDPGSHYMGLGILRDDGGADARAVRMQGYAPDRQHARIRQALAELGVSGDDEDLVAGCEEPPRSVTTKVRRGAQAPIGWKLGLMAGMAVGALAPRPVTMLSVSDWRKTMLGERRRVGLLEEAPSRRSLEKATLGVHVGIRVDADGRQWVRFRGCGHDVRCPSRRAIPRVCPRCAKGDPHVDDIVRDVWKRLACELVERRYPELYGRLVVEARSRAKAEDRPEHHLEGVADACEAIGVTLHVRRVETEAVSAEAVSVTARSSPSAGRGLRAPGPTGSRGRPGRRGRRR